MFRLIRPLATSAIVLFATAATAADGTPGSAGDASPPPASTAPSTPPPAAPPAATTPANTNANATVPPAQGGGTPAVVLDTQDYESLLGKSVRAMNGDDLGRIIDVIIDRDGRPRAAVIDFGGFLGVGSRKIAVDWRVLKFTSDGKVGRLTLQLNRNQVRVSPEYKSGEPIVVLGAASPGSAPSQPTEGDASAPVPEKAAAPAEKPAADKGPDRPQEKTPDR